MNPREELIALLRGSFATPVLAALGSSGAYQRMAAGPFTVAELFPNPSAATVGHAVLHYLMRLALVSEATPPRERGT